MRSVFTVLCVALFALSGGSTSYGGSSAIAALPDACHLVPASTLRLLVHSHLAHRYATHSGAMTMCIWMDESVKESTRNENSGRWGGNSVVIAVDSVPGALDPGPYVPSVGLGHDAYWQAPGIELHIGSQYVRVGVQSHHQRADILALAKLIAKRFG